jgi:carbon storage regulator CsrA
MFAELPFCLTKYASAMFFIDETVRIGFDMLTVLAATGSQVRVSFGTPRDGWVHREEVFARIQQEHTPVDWP